MKLQEVFVMSFDYLSFPRRAARLPRQKLRLQIKKCDIDSTLAWLSRLYNNSIIGQDHGNRFNIPL